MKSFAKWENQNIYPIRKHSELDKSKMSGIAEKIGSDQIYQFEDTYCRLRN